jgi:hypothetical protein
MLCWRATGAYQHSSRISTPNVRFGSKLGSLLILSNVWNVTSILWMPYSSRISPHLIPRLATGRFFDGGWWCNGNKVPIMKSPFRNPDMRLSWFAFCAEGSHSWITITINATVFRMFVGIVALAPYGNAKESLRHFRWISCELMKPRGSCLCKVDVSLSYASDAFELMLNRRANLQGANTCADANMCPITCDKLRNSFLKS